MRFLSTDKSWLGETSKQIEFSPSCVKHTCILILPNDTVMERCVKGLFIPQKRFHLGMRAGEIYILELYAISGRPKWMWNAVWHPWNADFKVCTQWQRLRPYLSSQPW